MFGSGKNDYKSMNSSGCGLGLTICQRIVKGLGGDISIYSVLDEGTSVQFFIKDLPCDDSEEEG